MTQHSTGQPVVADPATVGQGADLHLVEARPSVEPLEPMEQRGARVSPDITAATQAAEDFLIALGVPPLSEGTSGTPERMARAYAEMLTPRTFDLTTFPNDEGYDELLVAKSLPVESLCEHHMLPFTGVAHVGYVPAARILGLSKFARVVELFARRPQTQERLTRQIVDWLDEQLRPRGIGVVIEATHTCMSLRGVRARGSTTVTSAVEGLLRKDARTRSEFLDIARGRTE